MSFLSRSHGDEDYEVRGGWREVVLDGTTSRTDRQPNKQGISEVEFGFDTTRSVTGVVRHKGVGATRLRLDGDRSGDPIDGV